MLRRRLRGAKGTEPDCDEAGCSAMSPANRGANRYRQGRLTMPPSIEENQAMRSAALSAQFQIPVPRAVRDREGRADRAPRELGPDRADSVVASARNSRIVPLDETTAIYAAALGLKHDLAAADALIYATALHHKATLVRCDAHFESIPGVEHRAEAAA
jgi:predicted nucleic acid-binding protein